MSGETEHNISGWTTDTLKQHGETVDRIRAAHASKVYEIREAHRLEVSDMQRRLGEVNDRRLTEVAIEREKALKIKEQADNNALELAREIQKYKDEKANELREQISSERGLYASKADLIATTEKIEATIAPLADFVTRSQGRSGGLSSGWAWILGGAGLVLTIMGIIAAFINMTAK